MDIVRDHAPVDVAQRFLDGADFFMKGGSLEEGLGLSTANGSRHPAMLYHMHLRNKHLYDAWLLCAEHDDKRTELLIQRVIEFEQFYWPEQMQQDQPPKQWKSKLRKHLFYAFYFARKRGVSVPRSERQINEIVGKPRTGYPVNLPMLR